MKGVKHGTTGRRLIGIYLVLYFLFLSCTRKLHLQVSKVLFAKAKIKSAKAKIKSTEDRSSELLKFKWKSHLKHCSTESTRKPQSLMSSIPSQICSYFSILNRNLTPKSQKSPFSLLPISSLKSQVSTLH